MKNYSKQQSNLLENVTAEATQCDH